MNLIKTQEQLNMLPPTPQSLELLSAAAKGMNLNIPPYMALIRLNEINRNIKERGIPKNPPTEPLNASLPKEIAQQLMAGTMGGPPQPQQGMPQQGMPAQPPQGMPQQGMPPQAPPEGQPVSAADGGLVNLPVDSSNFEYGSGGIVAFNGNGSSQVVDKDVDESFLIGEPPNDDDDDGEDDDDVAAFSPEGSGIDTASEFKALKAQIKAQLENKLPTVEDRAAILKRLTGEGGKNYGVDTAAPIGADYLKGLEEQRTANIAESEKQREENKRLAKSAFFKSLIDAGENTRGQTGIGGLFGGFGASWNKAAAEDIAREQGLRGAALKEQVMLNEVKYKVQELRRAQLDGDVKAEQKAQADLAKIAKDNNVSLNTLLGKMATGILGVAGRKESAKGAVEAAAKRNERPFAPKSPPRPSELSEALQIMRYGSEEDKAALKEVFSLKQTPQMAAVGEKASVAEDEAWSSEKLVNKEVRKLSRSTKSEDKAKLLELEDDFRARFRTARDKSKSGIATPLPAAPAAPAAASTTPPASMLTEGVITEFRGKGKWTLKNGQPIKVN